MLHTIAALLCLTALPTDAATPPPGVPTPTARTTFINILEGPAKGQVMAHINGQNNGSFLIPRRGVLVSYRPEDVTKETKGDRRIETYPDRNDAGRKMILEYCLRNCPSGAEGYDRLSAPHKKGWNRVRIAVKKRPKR